MFGQKFPPISGGSPGGVGEVVASYTDYAGAQRAVDYLSDNQFPVERTSIVGADLRLVENVLGRLDAKRATLSGAASGVWFGLLLGLFLGIFAQRATGWIWIVFAGIVWGALAGALFGWIGYRSTGGRRDFVSTSQLVAARYDVLVETSYAERARNLVGRLNL
ncbi:hypothetical protein LO772_13020 [Yinghuangia sp. ASG 101]|uniref:general stress protein n=1 Tax=Yinghuangia sp. ASG 101 TaxID=2896848 RepID=UPI001E4D1549|nr:general stress protein [Yinghuangia sp. ASG 101]UGQ14423.1 hypothetical protein LO772_13020 [Yinghuangia sp. ASG 101]